MLLLSTQDALAASGAWRENVADQGVAIEITSFGQGWALTSPATLMEGDAIYVGAVAGLNLGTQYSYYYAVGVGSTPADMVRFSQSPGSVTFAPNGTASPLTVTKVSSWSVPGNWEGGIVPGGTDDVATIIANPGTPSIMIDRDLTLGGLAIDTTNAAANGLSLFATSRNAGPLPMLTLRTSSGTPTLSLTGGKSFSFSESKISGTTPANASSKLTVVGDQGLLIDNQNAVSEPIAVNSTGVSTTPTYGSGAVRFGFGLDWSRFRGDLTVTRGVVQALAGGTFNNNLTAFPMHSKMVLGTGTNTARLEITGSAGQVVLRGLESASSFSSVINTSGGGLQTFELGSYTEASDVYDYAGNIGDSTYATPTETLPNGLVSSASAIRLVKVGPGTQILSGRNNLNAIAANSIMLALNGGKLSLGTTGALGVVTEGQGEMNANSSVTLKNGELEISGLGLNAPRSQKFGDWLLFGTIAANTESRDANQSGQGASFSKLTVVADPGQPASLTFGRIKPRNFAGGSPNSNLNGTTMLYRGTNLGAARGDGVASILFTTPPVAGIYGALKTNSGTGALETTDAPVLKGALADTSPTGHGQTFATYEAAVGVRPLKTNEQAVVSTGAAYGTAATSANIRLNLAVDETITGHVSNTLQIHNASDGPRVLTNTGVALDAANGYLFSGAHAITLTGGEIIGTAVSNAEDIVFHSINTSADGVILQTPVTNLGDAAFPQQGWIVYNGPGNYRLAGAQTTGALGGLSFNSTGVTTIAAPLTGVSNFVVNQGLVRLDAGAAWTNVPRLFVAPGAKLDLNGIGGSTTENRFSDISATVLAAGLTLNPIAGEITNSSATSVDLVLSGSANGATTQPFFGTITGNLGLVVDKSTFNSGTGVYAYGTQSIANVNTYSGSTRIRSGVLNIARGGQLPPTTVVTLGTPDVAVNSTLTLGDGNGSTNGHIRQEIAGLYAVGTGVAAVLNQGANIGQLTINTAEGVDNVYTGNLGQELVPNGNGQILGQSPNLFALRKIGAGSFEIGGAVNQYSGGTVIQGGYLRVTSDAKLGQIGSLTGEAGSYAAAPAPMSAFPNNIILDGGYLQASTTSDFVLNPLRGIGLGPVTGATGGVGGFWVDSGVTLTYAGVIASAGNTGTQTLVKNGPGLLALNGASTFAGVTQVSGGALGGTGSLASGVSVLSGGALAPGGAAVGTFTIGGALSFSTGSALNVDLAAPGTADLLQVGGAVSATGTTTINLTGLDGFGAGAYTLISGSSPISTANFRVGTVPSGFRGTLSSVGNTLVVTVAPGSALSAIESWRQENFGTIENTGSAADTADFDSDGIANLVEYATGTNPKVAGSSAITAARLGAFLTLTYARVADETLTYTVEGSNDLVTWTTVAGANNPSTGAQNVAGPVVVTDTVSITGASVRRFLRLKVSR